MKRTFRLFVICLALAVGRYWMHAEVVYFLVGYLPNPGEGWSANAAVLPLTRAEDIAHARALQARTPGIYDTIPVMKIAAGADGINRNHLAVGAPQWSWHVTELIAFAEGTVGSTFDTMPAAVEFDVAGFIEKNAATLAFSSYSFILELSPASLPVSVSVTPATNGLAVSWTNLGVDYVYTLEVSDSLTAPNWAPASGVSWPSVATRWVDTAASTTGSRFYRVKAQLKKP